MNCNNVRKYFYAFLDGELDVEKNIEVLAHLDICYECSVKIERERFIQKRVKEAVDMVKAPAYLERKILRGEERRPGLLTQLINNLSLRSRLIPLAGVATVLIIIASFFAIQNSLKRQAPLNASPGNVLLTLVEPKYHDYMKKQVEYDMRSRDAGEIVEYLQDQTGLSMTLPGIKDRVQLVGATLTEINGAKVPQVFCMHEGVPVVLFIDCHAGLDFSEMKEVMADKKVFYTTAGSCGACQIIGWEEAGNQYVMVSKLNSKKMISMLTKV